MEKTVAGIADALTNQLRLIPGVEAITLQGDAEISPDDPYFYLSLDLYYRGELPDPELRREIFSDTGAFESSSHGMKDRFFIDALPVRIEYKHIEGINRLVKEPVEHLSAFREAGTYMFYRIRHGKVIFQDGFWLEETRKGIGNLPDLFWKQLAESSRARAEHFLADLGSAVIAGDSLFYMVSLTGFIRSICSFLLAVNRRFEPSGRHLKEAVLSLPVLPENFRGRFDSLIRDDPEFGPLRKREVAELMTRSVLLLA